MRGLILVLAFAGCGGEVPAAPPAPPDPTAARVADLVHRAKEREQAGDGAGAEAAWEEVLALRPGHGSAFYASARLRKARGEFLGALERLAALRAVEPNAGRGWLLEADLRCDPAAGGLRDLGRAEEAAREALARNPEESGPSLALGRILWLRGKDAEAAERLEIAARMNPRDAESRSLRGVLALREGRAGEARRWFLDALRAGRPAGAGVPGEGDTLLSLAPDRPPTRGELRAAAGLAALGEAVEGYRPPPGGAEGLLGR